MTDAEILALFEGLSGEARLKILETLLREEQSNRDGGLVNAEGYLVASDIADLVEIRPSVCSHHLQLLEKAGLVESLKSGRFRMYRFRQDTFQTLTNYLSQYVACSSNRPSNQGADRAEVE